MRLLLDTCAVIDLLTDPDNLGKGALDMVSDPSNMLYASFETLRELIVHFNNKKLLSKQWSTAQDMIDYVENELDIEFMPLRTRVGYTYANLRLNTGQEHRDQGLDLIEY